MGLSMGSHISMGNQAAGNALGLVPGERINGQQSGARFLEQVHQRLKNGKTREHRLALRLVGKAL